MLKPKVGDMVRLKLLIIRDFSADDLFVYFENGQRARVDQIEEVLPRPLAVGDRVRTPFTQSPKGTILAFCDAWAWVFWDGATFGTYETKDLTRIDDAP